ncbi:MAG: tRNA (guanosine(37)-N1)-methyltransferase TrmD [Eubacteriales bacterium]|nr:tRNA (guanosine(37)-N1)-methyltransferase TrmD [Eubacteriales bacterium]
MNIRILTIFPGMLRAALGESILGRANSAGLVDIDAVDIRPFSQNKHKNTDDYPFGGGAGMLMLAQPIVDCTEFVDARLTRRGGKQPRHIYLSPRGRTFDQKIAEELAQEENIVLLCGHYEGVDERALEICGYEEMSLGDFVLTGGEYAALCMVDAVARLLPGVLGSEASPVDESFSSGLLEYPQYTRPREYRGLEVPQVLTNGNHALIEKWRREQSLRITKERRPEMLEKIELSKKDREYLKGLEKTDI